VLTPAKISEAPISHQVATAISQLAYGSVCATSIATGHVAVHCAEVSRDWLVAWQAKLTFRRRISMPA
jgi:hypothetical protein